MTLRKRSCTSQTNTTALDGSNLPPVVVVVVVPLLLLFGVMEAVGVAWRWRARRVGGDAPPVGGRRRFVVKVVGWGHPSSCDDICMAFLFFEYKTGRIKN